MTKRAMVALRALILVFAVLAACSAPALEVRAWGGATHRSIVENASLVFSSGSFFSTNIATIRTYSTKPDEWKSSDPYEANCRHWYHVDEPEGENEYYRGGLPNNWTLLEKGVLPWVLEDNFNMLVQRLGEGNWGLAAQLAGVIGHYIADASMPLHATSDYSPSGKHGAFETEVNNRLNEISIPKDNYVPTEMENIFAATMAMLEESYGYTGYTPDKLSYWLQQGILWNSTLQSITENRLRSATQLTANVWYTAMIRAGLTIQAPTLLQPENNAPVSTTPTLAWTAVSGVNSYDLQLAPDTSFASDVITIKGWSSTSYTIETPLEYGTWYWRVRSGDNSTHVGLWSPPQRFTTGKVVFSLATLYEISLDVDVHLDLGSKLTVKFHSYNNDERGENVIWNGVTPAQVILLENVPHPQGEAVERVALVLKDEEGGVISTVASFVVTRGVLWDRILVIKGRWLFAPENERTALWNEILAIKGRWLFAPA